MNPMEQPPQGMPVTQLPLDLSQREEKGVPETKEIDLQALETSELERRFQNKVGYDPRIRFLEYSDETRRAILIEGIFDPTKGKAAVAEWDARDDKIGDAWSNR